jgi:hypothetical protein
VSPYSIEPYLGVQVSGRLEITRADSEVPYQVQAGLAAGIRLWSFYLQVGPVLDLLPRSVNMVDVGTGGIELRSPGIGPAAEIGMRFAEDFF